MLNLSDITLKFRTTNMLVFVKLYEIFYTKSVRMFENCFHKILHNPSPNKLLVIILKVKAKLRFLTAVMLLFSVLQKILSKDQLP